jgi:peptidoglycan/LPS O-acetylase OafA/YrhL
VAVVTIEAHHYRADIDGLRALAIVAVVLFHAGVPGFTGGFVGVDVFFVISGYLITSIIEREMREGRFSIVRFYERRVRRILPALFAVMAFSALAAPALLYPEEYRSFARSLITATIFASSFQFRLESGYFDVEAESKPLLHTWSLSVEEIFYLVFPITFLLLWRWGRRRRIGVLWSIALLSLAASVAALYLDEHSKAAFYLAHFRAWEFLIGSLLALSTLEGPKGHRAGDLVSVSGLLLIIAAVFAYSQETSFPGLAALLPCLGTALIILSGQRCPSLVGRLLSRRPLVFTGLISYSLYLWHWPVLVFATSWLGRRLSAWEGAGLAIGSFFLAILSWRYIERPFRGKSGVLSRGRLFALSAGVGALFVTIGLHGELTGGWTDRYPDAVRLVMAARDDRDPRQGECLSTDLDADPCRYGRAAAEPVTALWGDSHAASYAVMLGQLAERQGESILAFTMPACPPVHHWQIAYQEWRRACARFQERTLDRILADRSIRTVLLAANFRAYVSIAHGQKGLQDALRYVVNRLLGAGKQVFLVYPYPTVEAHAFNKLIREAGRDGNLGALGQPLDRFSADNRAAFGLLDQMGEADALTRIYPHHLLCSGGWCSLYSDGRVLYQNEGHISLTGARALTPLFEPVFERPPDVGRLPEQELF